jgi:hypothetical protein
MMPSVIERFMTEAGRQGMAKDAVLYSAQQWYKVERRLPLAISKKEVGEICARFNVQIGFINEVCKAESIIIT